MDTVLSWFTNQNNSIDVGLLYYHEPDTIAHYEGVGEELAEKVREVDGYVGYLLDQLEEKGLDDEVKNIEDCC